MDYPAYFSWLALEECTLHNQFVTEKKQFSFPFDFLLSI